MFDDVDNRGEQIEEYYIPNNFEERYKIMEADSIMNMVEYALRHICFIIDIIVSDNDIKM